MAACLGGAWDLDAWGAPAGEPLKLATFTTEVTPPLDHALMGGGIAPAKLTDALEAAKRELIEETGYRAAHWRRILKFYASPGFMAETMSVYLASGLRRGEAEPEDDEVIEVHLVPLPKAVKMVLNNSIQDGKTISSVLWLDHALRTRGKAALSKR